MSNDKKSQNAIQDLNEFYTKLNPEMEPLSSPTSDTGNEVNYYLFYKMGRFFSIIIEKLL